MPDMATAGMEVTVWVQPPQAALVEAVLTRLAGRVRCIGLGGPRTAEIDVLAAKLQCPREDDLRKLLVEKPAAHLLAADSHGLDLADMKLAVEQGTTLLGLEPLTTTHPGGESAMGRSRGGNGMPWLLLPAFMRGEGWTKAADPLQATGAVRQVRMTSTGQSHECSLLARLMDVWRTLLTLAPMPTTVDATLVGPLAEVPEDLRGLTGLMTAHGRLPGSGAVLIQAADRGGASQRSLEIFGDTGHLRVSDDAYDLHDTQGALLDASEMPAEQSVYADLVAQDWKRLIDQPSLLVHATASGPDLAEVLACVMACRLSSRTGEPESPQKMLELAS
ncbi:MAG: hypothetical protein IT440_10640 [Phycisphaeraceae bacterium]|nr:hypothetical protein [Phycisphaeraceae bacterium]